MSDYRFTGPYKAQAIEGWSSAPGERCPYGESDLGARCAWLAGHYDKHGVEAWEKAR